MTDFEHARFILITYGYNGAVWFEQWVKAGAHGSWGVHHVTDEERALWNR